MPELPEVETIKNSLKKRILGKTIKDVSILYQTMIKTSFNDFKSSLINVTINDITRKGKFLIFHLSNQKVLISHLRMEGKYYFYDNDKDVGKHARIIFYFTNDEIMVYDDSRKFGIMGIYDENNYELLSPISKLAKEPFDITNEELFNKLMNKNIEIKSALLDQSILAGLGNIYVDEVLYDCKINPFKKANKITLCEVNNIIASSIKILNMAIEKGGSTISSYHPEKGVDGLFQINLKAYGNEGKQCSICHSLMLKDFCHGRGTTYCPNCQNVAIKIAIYGKIASGKSTVLKYFNDKGYLTFSSDYYISELYKLDQTKIDLIKIFGEAVLNDNGVINKTYIKNIITENPKKKKELENYFHPLVENKIKALIKNNRELKLIICEVPLLYESNMRGLFDYVIGVDALQSIQLRNLRERGSKNPMLDLTLNSNNNFNVNAKKCDFIINNNSSIDDLYSQIDVIIKKLIK